MKILFFLLLFPLPSFAADCADLAGKYSVTDENGLVDTILIRQHGCASVEIEFKNEEGFLVVEKQEADGQPHVVTDDESKKIVRTVWLDLAGLHKKESYTVREPGELDETYLQETEIFKPKADQLVVKWEKRDPTGLFMGRGKTTYIRDSAACPNFSGKFFWSDDEGQRIDLAVKQANCESMEMDYDGFGVTVKDLHVFDGKPHLIADHGDFKAVETATINDAGIKILEERWLSTEDGDSHYFVDIEILKPRDDQVVIKRTTVSESGQRDATDKMTYTRSARE